MEPPDEEDDHILDDIENSLLSFTVETPPPAASGSGYESQFTTPLRPHEAAESTVHAHRGVHSSGSGGAAPGTGGGGAGGIPEAGGGGTLVGGGGGNGVLAGSFQPRHRHSSSLSSSSGGFASSSTNAAPASYLPGGTRSDSPPLPLGGGSNYNNEFAFSPGGMTTMMGENNNSMNPSNPNASSSQLSAKAPSFSPSRTAPGGGLSAPSSPLQMFNMLQQQSQPQQQHHQLPMPMSPPGASPYLGSLSSRFGVGAVAASSSSSSSAAASAGSVLASVITSPMSTPPRGTNTSSASNSTSAGTAMTTMGSPLPPSSSSSSSGYLGLNSSGNNHGNNISATSFSTPGILSSETVAHDRFVEAAQFILESKSNNEAAALDFVRGMYQALLLTPPPSTASLTRSPNSSPESNLRNMYQLMGGGPAAAVALHEGLMMPSASTRIPTPSQIPFIGDDADARLATLVIVISGKEHVVGHLIGKGGIEVGRIESELNVTVRIESVAKNSGLAERTVTVIGAVAAVTIAQQKISYRVNEKLLSEGILVEVLKICVPNENVRHLIGKAGSNIHRLQNESGARIQVENESSVVPGAAGRAIVVLGPEISRTYAQYLILRQISADSMGAATSSMLGSPSASTSYYPRSPQIDAATISGGSSSSSTTASTFLLAPAAATGGTSPPSLSAPHLLSSPGHYPSLLHLQLQQQQQQQQQQQPHATPGSAQGAPPPAQQPTHGGGEDFVAELTVPESSVAFLIGRGGTSITSVQNQSGAKISFSKPPAGGGGSSGNVSDDVNNSTAPGRIVTISGTRESVETAGALIQQKLALYRGMRGSGGSTFGSPTSGSTSSPMR